MNRITFVCCLLWLLASSSLQADEIRIAVASNFASTMTGLINHYQTVSPHRVVMSTGSTGKHYAQIKHGAPFDIFFAADAARPLLLEQEGIAQPGSRFTYAIGKLVLWSPHADFVDQEGRVLSTDRYRFLAIANPRLAPYGYAAQQVLQRLQLWDTVMPSLVRGENINQAFQYVQSGNAQLGFVAYAQIRQPGKPLTGSYWLVPRDFYTDIEQQAVLLKDSQAARDFVGFMKGAAALNMIRDYGYDTP